MYIQTSPLQHLLKCPKMYSPFPCHISCSLCRCSWSRAGQMRQFILLAEEVSQFCWLAFSRWNVVDDRTGGSPKGLRGIRGTNNFLSSLLRPSVKRLEYQKMIWNLPAENQTVMLATYPFALACISICKRITLYLSCSLCSLCNVWENALNSHDSVYVSNIWTQTIYAKECLHFVDLLKMRICVLCWM
jgi:hypothetical protein